MKFKVALVVLVFCSIACGTSPAPTAIPVGTSRQAPVPLGEAYLVGHDMNISVSKVRRPIPMSEVTAGNRFNQEPEPGYEYVMVTIQADCLEDPAGERTCTVTTRDFGVTGSAGQVYGSLHALASIGMEDLLEDTEFYGGSSASGRIMFEVQEGETDLLLIYEPWGSIFTDKVYLSLE